ncbi:MAG: septum formation protein Maf [Planctomycetes bacterium]|nr:septum formation protein Maf [Planctomycetota bacterium]
MTTLHLASRSPRRRELLTQAGISFECVDGDVDESLQPGTLPETAVCRLAEAKARAGAQHVPAGLVLGADTLVALEDTILGKPTDRVDARRMLSALSGRRHRVLTGVCVLDASSGRVCSAYSCTFVTMRTLDPQEIAAYVDSGEADDKAGAYAIQEHGDRFVTCLEGDWDNVVGLPLRLVRRLLAEIAQP